MAQLEAHVLITGGTGQVGIELLRADWPAHLRLHAPGRSQLGLNDAQALERYFAATPFAAVINSAAHTAVDKAEDEAADAFAANAMIPALLADATRVAGIPLIHISTDYVSDGSKGEAYVETDPVAPLGVYGASKLAGEIAVLAGNPQSVVLRTAWVFSAHRTNFVKTMLRIGAQNSSLKVVNDQFGCPTSAADIASVLKAITMRFLEDTPAPTGLYHFVNAGDANWHQFAQAIFEATGDISTPDVIGISTAEYPTRATRPRNSRLSSAKLTDSFGITPRHWSEALLEVIAELKQGKI